LKTLGTDIYFLLAIFFLYLYIVAVFYIFFPYLKSLMDQTISAFSKFRILLRYFLLPSKTDFILQISRKKKFWFSKNHKLPHYPPPGYGIPPSKKYKFNKNERPDKYQMTLVPGGLNIWIFGMLIGLSFIAIAPLGFVFANKLTYSLSIFSCLLVVIIGSVVFYYLLYSRMARPVLSDIWAIWPESCNHMLHSVPHRVKLSQADKSAEKSKLLEKYPIYWNPKPNTPLARQPREYAANIPTLQAVLLNFSLFDLFFYKKPTSNEYSNVLNVRIWATYWMSPVWGSYLFLSVAMVVYFIVIKTWFGDPQIYELKDGLMFMDYLTKAKISFSNASFPDATDFLVKGGSFVVAICLWMVFTAWFIHKRLAKMIEMKDKVSSGYFKRYEELVPQQILHRLTDIPEEQQIASIIEKQRIIFNFLLFGAFVNFLLVLDALK
jgi:hypothetical protein